MWALYTFVFFEWLGFGIVLPILPFHALQLGASPVQVTALTSTYGSCPVSGIWCRPAG